MTPRNRRRSRAVALSVVALSAIALIPTASAATSSGVFQVTAVDEDKPSITKTVGMRASAADPGDGEGTPSCTLTMPESIRQVGLINGKLNTADQTLSMGAPYMAALTGRASGSDYGISGWIDEVQDSGGTVEIGEPTIGATAQVDSDYVTVPAPQLRSMIGEAKIIGAGQVGDDWGADPGLKDQVNAHSSIHLSGTKSADDFQDPVYELMVNAGHGGKLIQIQSVNLDYPISVKWDSGSKYAPCSVSMTAHMDVDIAGY